MTTHKRSFTTALWDFFCSLKLSIALLIGLALTSIIGTIIKQNASLEEYQHYYTDSTIRIFNSLGFFDMYHSWWFRLLLYLLTVNLVACSIKRLPRVWKMIAEPALVMDEGLEKSLALTHEFKLAGDSATLRDKLIAFLSREFAPPVVTEVNGEYHLFAQKARWCRLGVYVVHLSIIIIFIGAIIGSSFGAKGFVQIPEGQSVASFVDRYTGKTVELGYTLALRQFEVESYPSGAPKEYRSFLTVLENGQPVPGYIDRKVIVNDPLSYKGITFYQSSYGAIHQLTMRDRKGGVPFKIEAVDKEPVSLPGGGFAVIAESVPDVSPYMPGFTGPAVKVELEESNGMQQSVILLQNNPKFDLQRGGAQVFTYEGKTKYFTGLQVAKDPGVWVVWLGCALMVIGICMAFFMSHRRVWARISEGKVVLGATASKNQPGFQLNFDELADKLEKL